MGTLHEDQYTFLIISRSILLRMRNVSDKLCKENKKKYFVLSNFSNIVSFMRKCEKNVVEPERPQTTTERKRVGYLRLHTTHTHTEYIMLTAFPLQQWLYGCACMLRFTSIACLVSVFTVGYTANDAETMKTLRNMSVATQK